MAFLGWNALFVSLKHTHTHKFWGCFHDVFESVALVIVYQRQYHVQREWDGKVEELGQ